MTNLVRRYLKTAVVFLFIGLLLGLWLSAAIELELFTAPYPLRVAHTHLILVGFVMMMIMGVALWMFPRPAPEDGHYRAERMEFVWWVMTSSVCVRTAAEVATGWWSGSALRMAIFLASAAEVLGIALFFWNLWTRIRSPREAYERSQGTSEAPRR